MRDPMDRNPLFSANKNRPFHYGTSVATGTSDQPPAAKRRREETGSATDAVKGDDLWDEGLELSQKELDDLDTIAIQAYGRVRTTQSKKQKLPLKYLPKPETSVAVQETGGTFMVPRLIHRSSSSSSSVQPFSSHSSNSLSTSSLSSKSGHSLVDVSKQFSDTTLLAKDSGSKWFEARNKELVRLKSQCEKHQQENSRIQEELYGKDGEIKILRENLLKSEMEKTQCQQEKLVQLEEQARENRDKQTSLQNEIDKLIIQLQFKDREFLELQDRCTSLEVKLQTTQLSLDRSTQVATFTSPIKKKVKIDKPLPKKNEFPSKQSFLAEEALGNFPVSVTSTKGQESSEEAVKVEYHAPESRGPVLAININEGCVSGPHLVSKLLEGDIEPFKNSSFDNRGLIDLLQPHTTMDFHGLWFDRDASSLLLSPQAKRREDVRSADDSSKNKSLVSPVHLQLAVHGIRQLLHNDTCIHTVEQTPSVLLLLPLLSDYLGCYVDQLSSKMQVGIASPRGSSSCESSVESLSSSCDLFLSKSADYANNLEHLTLLTLQMLSRLASLDVKVSKALLEAGGDIFLEPSTDAQTLAMETDTSSKKEGKGRESISSQMQISCCTPATLSSDQLNQLHFFLKLSKLANPGCGVSCNPQLVTAALVTLWVVACRAGEAQLDRFLPLLTDGVLTNCFLCEKHPSIIIWSLNILLLLVKSEKIIRSFCTDPENCVLLHMYLLCNRQMEEINQDTRLRIHHLIIDCLTGIITKCRHDMAALVETDCSCNIEVVKSIVLMLYTNLKHYQCYKDDAFLMVLRKGLLLLYTFSQKDPHFEARHHDVQHQYVILISSLLLILGKHPQTQANEVSVLKELWDFDQDSQEEEEAAETSMDTS